MRPLTDREREVLIAMIEHANEGHLPDRNREEVSPEQRARWLSHVPELLAGEKCACSTCPTISLTKEKYQVWPGRVFASEKIQHVLEAGVRGRPALLLLFIDEDEPYDLELAPFNDSIFDEFPPVSELTF